MVLFINVSVGQRVEVLRGGRIHKGTVKFKGSLNGIPGDWVGVELHDKLGKHDGMVGGRRYFKCMPGHGIFTTASKIRFIPLKRSCYNVYKSVSSSQCDETLFHPERRSQEFYEQDAANNATNQRNLADYYEELTSGPAYYPRCHSVSRSIAPALTKTDKSKLEVETKYKNSPYKPKLPIKYDTNQFEFISSPSIPKTHMPHTALKNQVYRGWDNAHYAREMSVNTGRESFTRSSWNYL